MLQCPHDNSLSTVGTKFETLLLLLLPVLLLAADRLEGKAVVPVQQHTASTPETMLARLVGPRRSAVATCSQVQQVMDWEKQGQRLGEMCCTLLYWCLGSSRRHHCMPGSVCVSYGR